MSERSGRSELIEAVRTAFDYLNSSFEPQLNLFGSEPDNQSSLVGKHIKLTGIDKLAHRIKLPTTNRTALNFDDLKSVYVAAPFTNVAADIPSDPIDDQRPLFKLEDQHGEIPKGNYRNTLNRICRWIEKSEFTALLPHRDINKWGKRHMTEKQVAEECIAAVEEYDVFLGIVGTSFGSHLELGIALALKKPVIIFLIDELGKSFISSACTKTQRVTTLRSHNLAEVPKVLKENPFLSVVREAERRTTHQWSL